MHKKLAWAMLPTIFTLAWPTMLEQLMQTAVQYIDTAMVGALGTHATAAVGSTTTVNWLISSTISALGVGFLSYVARSMGEGNRSRIGATTVQATWAVLVSGILFTILSLGISSRVPVWMQVDPAVQELASQYFFIIYMPMLPRAASIIYGTLLRAAGDTKTPMQVGILVNVTNLILNFLLIYPTRSFVLGPLSLTLPGAGWGVLGAAVASAVAFALGGIITTLAVFRHRDLSPRGLPFRPDWEILKPCLKVAAPNMLQRFGTCLGYVAFASMINSLGEISTAAHTIANTVESAFYIPGYGMQTAAATLAGNYLGAKDKKSMQDLALLVVVLEVAMMIVSGALLFLFAPSMMGLFSTSAQVILLGSIVLRMVAVSEPFYGVSIVLEGMMLGVGNTIIPFVFNIAGMWGIRIVGTWILTEFFGGTLIAAWGCMIAHNLALFAMFTVHYLRGRWNPLTAQDA